MSETTVKSFEFGTIQVHLYSCNHPAPVLYMNAFSPDISSLLPLIQKQLPSFHLVWIDHLNWDDDLTPWYCPPIFAHDIPCGGKSEQYLALLTDKIIPYVEKEIQITRRIIAGYSLGGLFAFWSLFACGLFDQAVCMSASFWFPDFVPFVLSHHFVKKPSAIYFSLGNQEAVQSNPYLKNVQINTEKIFEYVKDQGIDTTFVLNKGGHTSHVFARIAQGIDWILNQPGGDTRE